MFRPEVVRPSEHRLILRYPKFASILRAPLSELVSRWGKLDEYLFDSTDGTLAHNGKVLGKVASVVLWLYRADDDRHQQFRVKLLLDNGTKLEPLISSSEKFVTHVAEQIAAFLGKHVEIDYHSHVHGHPVQSLNLAERELEEKK